MLVTCPVCKKANSVGKIGFDDELNNDYFCSNCYVEFNHSNVYSIDKDGIRHILYNINTQSGELEIPKTKRGYSDQKLRSIIFSIEQKIGKIPTKKDLRKFNYSTKPFERRYGSYINALIEFYGFDNKEIQKRVKRKSILASLG